MTDRKRVFGLLAVLVLILTAAIVLVLRPVPHSSLPPLPEYPGMPALSPPPAAHSLPAEAMPAQPYPGGTLDDDAPWLHPLPPAVDRETAEALVAEKTVRAERLHHIQQQLHALGQQSEPDPQALDRLLGELVDVQGSHIVGGVDMQIVRGNLQRATEMQQLGKQLEVLAAAGESPQNLALMQEKVARIQALQQALRTDVRVSE